MNSRISVNTIIVFIIALFMIGCDYGGRKKDVVTVSLLPQKFFVDRLSGGSLDVNVMIPPGASHATYSPTPQQYKKLSDSRIYIGIGHLGYEQSWMPLLNELNPDIKLLNLSEKTQLITTDTDHGKDDHSGHSHHGVDPHIWMSPAVMLELLPYYRSALIENFPEFQSTIEENYVGLYNEIYDTHTRMEELSSTLTSRTFMIFHPALTYLARDYGLNQLSIEREGKEPSPGELVSLIRQSTDRNISVIFIQQEYDIRNAQKVSEETGVPIVQINPMAYEWLELMDQLIDLFKKYMYE